MDSKNKIPNNTKLFPPVVAVLGHVDHGKTTLLDAIRKTNIADREKGGITQKIGASSIEVFHEGKKRNITFIDTPGHEVFYSIRSRGAQAADIGLLVVSSSDGVMPQTKESIKHLLDSKIPFIVVLTKADLPDKRIEKVKQQLLKEGVMLEGLGGDIPVIEVSAKTNLNIKELLELIILVDDMKGNFGKDLPSESGNLKAIVIESKLDKKAGPKATLVIKNGSLNLRDELICDGASGRVRTLINDKAQQIKSTTVGEAVEVLGFENVPAVGGLVVKKGELNDPLQQIETKEIVIEDEKPSYVAHMAKNVFSVIICADTLSSLEAIINSIPKEINIVSKKTGEVNSADILLAKSTGAMVLGFNVPIKTDIFQLAKIERVLLKNYEIIYELIDEVKEALEGKALSMEEEIFGRAKVLASFPYEKTKILGISVLEGRIAKGDKVRLMREDAVLGESTVSSLRRGKESVSRIEKGNEGGVLISPFLDFTIGDVLLCHR